MTNTPEQERFITWGPEGKSVVYSSERNGKWSIYKTEKLRKEDNYEEINRLFNNFTPDFSLYHKEDSNGKIYLDEEGFMKHYATIYNLFYGKGGEEQAKRFDFVLF